METGIVIPVFNQLDYTRQCLESIRDCAVWPAEIVVIDNGSRDGTAEYLRGQDWVKVICNAENRGCAAAWNQGFEALNTTWTVFLNNDVLVSPGWLDGMLEFALEHSIDVVSPGIREGELNYDIESYAPQFVERMQSAIRPGAATGICFMIHRRVFEAVGRFDENFRVGQFEDADFFLRARRTGFRIAITGRSFVHHFGSVTQQHLRREHRHQTGPYEEENRRYFRRKWKLHWARRRWIRLGLKLRGNWWSLRERRQWGHSLNEKWIGGRLHYE